MLKKFLPFIFIITVSFWAVEALFRPGFFPMHDDEQIARLYELHQALLAGQFPPRWIADLGFGFGYPFYNFYPPFVYYLGEIFYFLDFSLLGSTKIVMIVGFLLAAVFMYLLAKEFFGKVGGLVAAVFYTYAPYHALDLYVRGALAEFYSFVFIPAVFWSTFKLVKEKSNRWLVINTLFLSFLLLSHNLIALVFIPFYFAYFLFQLKEEKEKKIIFFLFSFSVFLFLGLTAYFWLPAISERKYTLVDQILTAELASYKLHFVYLRQFWNSPWGYGGSIYGLEDGLSFEVGKLHLIVSSLAGLLGGYSFLKRKKEAGIFLFSVFCFLFSVFMASFYSQSIWDSLKPLWYLQFPWRFLVFAAFFSSFLAGGLIGRLFARFEKRKKFRWVIMVMPVLMVVALHKDYFRPARYLPVTDWDYVTREDLNWRVSKMAFEYVPKGIATTLSDIQTTQVDIKKEELPSEPFKANGDLRVISQEILPHRKVFLVEGEGGVFTINTYNFPGWQVKIDGEKTVINDNNKFKLMTLKVPPGRHRIEAEFGNTTVRTLGNFLTLISLLALPIVWRRKN